MRSSRDAAAPSLRKIKRPFSNGALKLILPTKNNGHANKFNSHARQGQILRQLYRYSFCPVLGFKNSLPLFLRLLKLNIWVMELAIPSKEP